MEMLQNLSFNFVFSQEIGCTQWTHSSTEWKVMNVSA